jgi:hypothetical protein
MRRFNLLVPYAGTPAGEREQPWAEQQLAGANP